MKTKKKSPIRSLYVRRNGVDVEGLRHAAEKSAAAFAKHGPENADAVAFAATLGELVESRALRYENVRDLGELMRKLGPVKVPALVEDERGRIRTIQTGAFPTIVSHLNLQAIDDAYEDLPDPTGDLVREIDDRKKVTFLPLIKSESSAKDGVDEGEDFPLMTSSEEVYEIHHRKDGRRVRLTREMFEESDVAGIIDQVAPLAKVMAEKLHRRTAWMIYDVFGSAATPQQPYALRPKSGVTSLYSATANTPGVRAPSGTRITNNPLTTTANLEAARVRLNANLSPHGHRTAIPVSRCKLLVPDALLPTALKLLGSELEPGAENELNNWGPRGQFRPQIVSSPIFDEISTTAWLYGDFMQQFVRKWKQRPTFVELGAEGQQAYLDSDVAYQARLSWDFEVGARDYAFVVQCLSGTTAPTVPSR